MPGGIWTPAAIYKPVIYTPGKYSLKNMECLMSRGKLNIKKNIRTVGICVVRRFSTRVSIKDYHETIGTVQAGCTGDLVSFPGLNGPPIIACVRHAQEIRIAQHILKMPNDRKIEK
jgi:hypothetical protein